MVSLSTDQLDLVARALGREVRAEVVTVSAKVRRPEGFEVARVLVEMVCHPDGENYPVVLTAEAGPDVPPEMLGATDGPRRKPWRAPGLDVEERARRLVEDGGGLILEPDSDAIVEALLAAQDDTLREIAGALRREGRGELPELRLRSRTDPAAGRPA